MNFLAHAFLSPDNDLIRLGNTFGDFVKGKKMLDVHPEVIKGVLLHRFIDDYTDSHALFKKAIEVFKPDFGRFSAILVDMTFDYLLAKYWCLYSSITLEDYVTQLFQSYDKQKDFLTDRMRQIAPVMRMQEWMLKYQSIEGLSEILTQMSNRIGNRVLLQNSIPIIEKEEKYLYGLFVLFFKDLLAAVKNNVEG